MPVVIANNATSLLAAAIDADDNTISVLTGDAGKFPNPAAGDWFPLTVVDNAGNMEILKATARNGAIITVERAQEGTTAKAFSAGARVDHRLTAGAIRSLNYLPSGGGRLRGTVKVQVGDSNGAASIVSGDDDHTGYLEGWLPDGKRGFYFGWASPGGPVVLSLENGLTGLQVQGSLQVDNGFTSVGVGSTRGVFRNTGAGDSWLQFFAKDFPNSYAEFGLRSNGAAYAWVNGHEFRFQTNGQFWSATDIVSRGTVYAGGGSAYFGGDGNIFGSRWGSWGGNTDAFVAIDAQIEKRGREYADDRKNGCVTDTRFAGWYDSGIQKNNQTLSMPSGYVMTGLYLSDGSKNFAVYGRQPQVYIPYVGWRALGGW